MAYKNLTRLEVGLRKSTTLEELLADISPNVIRIYLRSVLLRVVGSSNLELVTSPRLNQETNWKEIIAEVQTSPKYDYYGLCEQTFTEPILNSGMVAEPGFDPQPSLLMFGTMYVKGMDREFWQLVDQPQLQDIAQELRDSSLSDIPAWIVAITTRFPDIHTTAILSSDSFLIDKGFPPRREGLPQPYLEVKTQLINFGDCSSAYTIDLRSSQKCTLHPQTRITPSPYSLDKLSAQGARIQIDDLGTIQMSYEGYLRFWDQNRQRCILKSYDSRKLALEAVKADQLLHRYCPDACQPSKLLRLSCRVVRNSELALPQVISDATYYTIALDGPYLLNRMRKPRPSSSIRLVQLIKYILGLLNTSVLPYDYGHKAYSHDNRYGLEASPEPPLGLSSEHFEYLSSLDLPQEYRVRWYEVLSLADIKN
jgi:hypothetical protein